jgi:hypothetical protein
MKNEKQTTIIVNNDDNSQAIIPPQNDKNLPKLELKRGESLNISREQISKLNDEYYVLIGELIESGANIPAELRSYMESVIFNAYVSDVDRLRRDNELEYDLEQQRVEALNRTLKPYTWRNWWWVFKIHRNQSKILLDELVSRQAGEFLHDKACNLPHIEGETPNEPYEVTIEELKELLPRRMKKKKRAAIEEAIESLTASYTKSVNELEEARKASKLSEEKIDELQKLIDSFVTESAPAPADETPTTENKPQNNVKNEATTPETIQTNQEPQKGNTADDNDEDGLYYGDLDKGDE